MIHVNETIDVDGEWVKSEWLINVITVINRGGTIHVAVDEGASQADWQVNVITVINWGGTIHVAHDMIRTSVDSWYDT